MSEVVKKQTLKDYLEKQAPAIKMALPKHVGFERFTRVALTALAGNQKLRDCTPISFLGALMTSAQLGLEVNTPLGYAYLIPYKEVCQFQIGYKGLLDLAYRSGQVEFIQANVVREGDVFDYEFGINPVLKHKPAMQRGKALCYYAVLKLKSGGAFYEVMNVDEVTKHKDKFSKAKSDGTPWATDFDEMAKKTVLKKVLKYAPLSIEVSNALSADESVKMDITSDMSLVPNEILEEEPVSVSPLAEPLPDPLAIGK